MTAAEVDASRSQRIEPARRPTSPANVMPIDDAVRAFERTGDRSRDLKVRTTV